MDPTPVVTLFAKEGILGLVIATLFITLVPVIVYLYRKREADSREAAKLAAEMAEKRLIETRELIQVAHNSTDAMNKVVVAIDGFSDLLRAITQKGGSRGV